MEPAGGAEQTPLARMKPSVAQLVHIVGAAAVQEAQPLAQAVHTWADAVALGLKKPAAHAPQELPVIADPAAHAVHTCADAVALGMK